MTSPHTRDCIRSAQQIHNQLFQLGEALDSLQLDSPESDDLPEHALVGLLHCMQRDLGKMVAAFTERVADADRDLEEIRSSGDARSS